MKKIVMVVMVFILIIGLAPSAIVSGQVELPESEKQQTQAASVDQGSNDNPNAINYYFRRSWGGEGPIVESPLDMALDDEGNLLIADYSLSRVIKLNLNDWTTEIKGWPGEANRPLFEIGSIWVDKAGDIYVTTGDSFLKIDKNWNQVLIQGGQRQLTLPSAIAVHDSGRIFVLDLYGINVFDDQGTFLFSFCPSGPEEGECDYSGDLTFDSKGFLYIVEGHNNRVQKFTSNGDFILSWSRTVKENFAAPYNISIDASDNLYITDLGLDKVLVFSENGTYLREWGGWGDCDNCFKTPRGIVVKGGTVFVADAETSKVKLFTRNGILTNQWDGEIKTSGHFDGLISHATDELGNIYIADESSRKIIKFTPWGSEIMNWELNRQPTAITIGPGQEIFVLNYDGVVTVFDYSGAFLREWTSVPPGSIDTLNVAITNKASHLYIVDFGTNKIHKFSTDGYFYGSWGNPGDGDGELHWPKDIAIGTNGEIFITDSFNDRIQVFSDQGVFLYKFGQCVGGLDDLCFPRAIAIDGNGNLYIGTSESSNSFTIKSFSKSLNYLGSIGEYGLYAGNFQQIADMSLSKDGALLISDRLNSRVSFFTPNLPTPDPYSGLVQNGSFEKSPALMEWTHGGNLPVSRSSLSFNGSYAFGFFILSAIESGTIFSAV